VPHINCQISGAAISQQSAVRLNSATNVKHIQILARYFFQPLPKQFPPFSQD
jgi:hypothetical protein